MILAETTLIVAVLLVMSGAVRGITRKLGANDYTAAFLVLLILLLNLRGNIKASERFTLSLAAVFSLFVGLFTLATNAEKGKAIPKALFSTLGSSAIVFAYSLCFLGRVKLDPNLVALLLSLLLGLACALFAGRNYSICLFSALWGAFGGSTLHLIFFLKSGNIGGNYTFSVMWIGAISGLLLCHLFDRFFATTKSPRPYVYYEADRMKDEKGSKR